MKNPANWDIRTGIIKKIEDSDKYWDLLTEEGYGFGLSKKYNVAPRVGDTITLYTEAYSIVQGVDLNGTRLYYRTAAQAKATHLASVAKVNKKREAALNKEIDARNIRRSKLPKAFQDRLNRFESRNPLWRRDFETYELYVCEQAVSLAALEKDKPIDEWYKWFRDLDYKKQEKIWPQMDDGHSGNTFGIMLLLAHAFDLGKEDYVINYHGALATLVGCVEYGCHDG